MIPEDDRGLLLGDGLFETILATDGRLEHAEAHVDRMIRGCAVLGLQPPAREAALAAAERALADAGPGAGRAAVRLTLTAGSGRGLERPPGAQPRLLASASALRKPAAAVTLATAAVRRNESSPASRLKTLSYLDNILARAQARAAGADEALMLNTRGEIACAAAANLFWIEGGRLYTPVLECGVLDGIMRAQALAGAAAAGTETLEVRAGREALDRAEAVFLTNSLVGVQPVTALDGRTLGAHPLAVELSSRCR
jgi:branched-chain amino acid aminotransferase/4-amino-4-deoxychorismate lyase